MEGRIPQGRRPVEGGYESNGVKLLHALGNIDGVSVPGKTGEHLVRFIQTSMFFPDSRGWNLHSEARTSTPSENTK